MSRPFIPAGPPRFKHQMRGLQHLIRQRGIAALLWDPGTGKTATALDYMSLLALKAPSGEARVLVIAPLAAVDTWVSQSQTFVHGDVSVWAEALGGSIRHRAEALAARGGTLPRKPDRPTPKKPGRGRGYGLHRSLHIRARDHERATLTPADGPDGLPGPRLVIEVVNFDAFASRAANGSKTAADLMVNAVRAYGPDLMVVDESHRIKSNASNTSRALARLTAIAPRRIILTGTVMPHSPLDVFGQWRFLDPLQFGVTDRATGQRRPASWTTFSRRYAVYGGYMGYQITGYRNVDELERVMAVRADVARKDDVLDLPPTTDVTIEVDLTPAERKAYDDMRDNLLADLNNGALASVPNRLAQMMRLRQITSGYLPDDVSGTEHRIGQSKVRVVKSIVQDTLAGEKRVVVFAHFRPEIEALRTALGDEHTTVETIHGGTPARDRAAILARFGDTGAHPERVVLVAQTRTMSLAVNDLVTASHAVYASLSQQREDYEQSRARLDRQGQTRPVTLWHAIVPGTIDEVVLAAHRTRTSVEEAVLEHVKNGAK